MNVKTKKNSEKGVTLLTLGITIIILIILSSVTINMTLGDNGLVSQAQKKNSIAINKINKEDQLMNSLTEEYSQTMSEDSISKITVPMSSKEISKDAGKYYGAEVKGYECENNGVQKWRIFYADNSNIYLIADDYISYDKAPNGKNGTPVTKGNNDYQISFNNVINDYSEGAKYIKENSKGIKWLNQYLEKYEENTNENIKATAYMMDTNIWSTYAGEDAEYAIGGPTLEMYCESYKDTHQSKYLECGNINSNGYQIRWYGGSWDYGQNGVANDYNEIYIKPNTSKAAAMWIASPSDYNNTNLMGGYYSNSIESYYYNGKGYGFRPIVCLKSETILQSQSDGSLKIIE